MLWPSETEFPLNTHSRTKPVFALSTYSRFFSQQLGFWTVYRHGTTASIPQMGESSLAGGAHPALPDYPGYSLVGLNQKGASGLEGLKTLSPMKTPRTAAAPTDCRELPWLLPDLGFRKVAADFSGGNPFQRWRGVVDRQSRSDGSGSQPAFRGDQPLRRRIPGGGGHACQFAAHFGDQRLLAIHRENISSSLNFKPDSLASAHLSARVSL